MLVRQSFDSRFVEKIKDIENKYGIEMLEADGIGPSKLDINGYARAFFKQETNVADISVDANANVDDKSVLSFEYEFGKALQKLNAYYIIWKRMVEDPSTGIKRANKILEATINGALKIHDQHHILRPYCYAFSLSELVMKGLPFIKKVKIGKPKHFKSFINLVIQFTAYASNQLAGATAFPDLFVYMDWFARKDFGEDYHENPEIIQIIKQELQSLVFSWNFPFRGSQSSFTNVNLYDDYFLHDLFSGTIYPDATKPNFESIKKLQQCYMEWFVEESKSQTFTFPVNTVTFYKNDDNVIQDNEFLELVSELNSYNGSFNIYTGPLGSLASCCRLRSDTTQSVEYVNSGFGVGGTSIGCYDDKTEILTENGWKLFKDLNKKEKVCTLNTETKKIEYQQPTNYFHSNYSGEMHLYKRQGVDLFVTPNHNMVLTHKRLQGLKIKQSQNISSWGHSIYSGAGEPKYINKHEDNIEINGKLFNTKLFFKFIGLYIGDGGADLSEKRAKFKAYEIPLYCGKDKNLNEIATTLSKLIGKECKIYKNGKNCSKLIIYSKELWKYIQPLGNCYSKYIPRELFNYSVDYLQELFNGLMLTDGTKNVYFKNNKLNFTKGKNIVYYTSSQQLSNDIQEIISLLGFNSRVGTRYPKPNTFFGKRQIYPKIQYEIFLHKNKSCCLHVGNKRKIKHYDGDIYCVEVPNHTLMVRRNNISIWCGNSHRVVTLNLPRIAFESEDDNDYFKKLEYYTNFSQDILDIHRKIIIDNINKDKLPLYTHNFMSLNKQFSTVGFIGINEACELQGYDIMDKEGSSFATRIISKINELNESRTKKDGQIRNVEQIPGESAAIALAKKDRLMFTNQKYTMYGNQYIPLWKNVDIEDRIKAQGMFDSMVSGGAICHINVTDSLTKEQMKKIILAAAHEGCIYFAINMNNARCKSCGKLFIGKFDKSPCHNAEVINYIRVVGFLVPVDSWIPQRREEYKVRQFYSKKDF